MRAYATYWVMLLIAGFMTAPAANAVNPGEIPVSSLEQVREQFADPPAAYGPAPLYVWNDDMQEEEIARQLDAFKAGGFGGVFVHPRPGLVTPYLSERWLEVWRFTAEAAKKRGMVTYIYDENSYPSGFAGGFVPDQMPDAAQVSLHRREFKPDQLDQLVLDKDSIALYQIVDSAPGEYKRLPIPKLSGGQTKSAKDLQLAAGAYILYSRRYGGASPWYGGKTFVDLMRRDVTEKFLEVTLGAYDQALSDLYGNQVLACFTDEPQVAGCWSPEIPKAFQKRWGYDILDYLPSIHADMGDWRKIRHDYSATILELFMNNFAKLYYEACQERGIAFTGHVWEHGWPHINHNPDIMSFYAWQRWPGIDCLMNNYDEGPNAQFGNYRSNKELDSIANQFGRIRRLCETYGAGGWELTLEDVKRIGDHLYAGGVNLMNPHLSYYTIRGARKRDHPQSFSYHAPYWEAFHIPMNYFNRLSWALAAGKAKNPILIIQPTVSAWMYNWSGSQGEKLNQLGVAFQRYVTELGASQIAFDLGSEPVMADHGKVDGKQFIVGECAYDVVILPPGLDCLE
ncbi:MAG: glycosyl hydrolase, partial [Candidatus Hinthialibacter sp.]